MFSLCGVIYLLIIYVKSYFRSYFSENGIEYNLCRVPIAGTDFSTRSYSYDDGAADPTLKNFHLAEEDFKIKVIFKSNSNIFKWYEISFYCKS